MAIRDKFRANAAPHLEPGETIQAVFGAQTHSAWLMVATGAIPFLFFNKYVVVAVTDRRIVLGKATAFSATKFTEVLASVPRQTQIGPAKGLWYKTESLGRRLYIHKRFHGDVEEADRLAGVGSAPPPAVAPPAGAVPPPAAPPAGAVPPPAAPAPPPNG